MEDFQLDIVLGKGPAARSIRLDLPRFTLVGATTRTGLITGPLRDRFGLVARLDYYAAVDLESIVVRAAGILGVDDRPGRRRRDRPPGPRHPPHRQPPAAPRPRLRRGARATARSTRSPPTTAWRCSGSTTSASTRSTGPSCRSICRALRRRAGRPVDAGHQRRRAHRDRRGRLRAVPHPAGPAHAHPTGSGGHAGGVGAPRSARAGQRHRGGGRRPAQPVRLSPVRPGRSTDGQSGRSACGRPLRPARFSANLQCEIRETSRPEPMMTLAAVGVSPRLRRAATHGRTDDRYHPSGEARSTSMRRGRRLPVALTVMLAVLMSLVPLVALEAVGASPVSADPTCPCSLWAPETLPAIVDFDDAQAVELGVQFSSTPAATSTGSGSTRPPPTPASTSAASGPPTARFWPRPRSPPSPTAAGSR